MTTKNQWSSRALAVAAAFMVSACADPTTASIRPLESTPLKAVGDAVDNVLRVEVLKVCKVWVGQAATDVNATLSNAAFANHLASFSIPASTGQCRSVAEDLGADAEHDHSVTEAAQAVGVTTTWTIDSNDNADDASGSGLVSGNVTMGGFIAPGTPRGAVITFTNTVPPPPEPEVCDFITFGRLVLEVGNEKVVISGNAGGLNIDASIKNEFHIDANDVDNHVADAFSYGPITSGPLFGLTNSRIVTGTAKNGVAVELRLYDGGEPGKGTDIVYVKLDGVELLGPNGQFIVMGNMQYHSNCRGPG